MTKRIDEIIPFRRGAALAPMAGVTDAAFRLLCHQRGAAWSVSEMLSAKGYLYAPRNSRATRELLLRVPHAGVTGLQLFGSDPRFVARAAEELSCAGYRFIDINMGCPAKKIVLNGEGSALMLHPERAAKIVRAVKDATELPVTVKIRAGWDEENVNAVSFARMLEDSGAEMITIHARTRSQFYGGRADWKVIAQVKRAVTIPVIGNGDITSGKDALLMIRETGCDGVMIGRRAQGNPWIFSEVEAALRGEAAPPVPLSKRILTALQQLDMMVALYGERSATLQMRKHVAWYLSDAPGCARMRTRIHGISDLQGVRRVLREYLDEYAAAE